jgi:DNA-binding beta-propeller fold protein YncE
MMAVTRGTKVGKIIRLAILLGMLGLAVLPSSVLRAETVERKLYVVAPGIRNYLEFGGAGVLVFDVDDDYRFVRRIQTPASLVDSPLNIKGVCAHAESARLFFTTLTHTYCLNLLDDQLVWSVQLPRGCDRLAMTPDGRVLYVPSLEKETWTVLDAATGETLAEIRTDSGAHNTVCGRDGRWMYLAGLRSPYLSIADTRRHEVARKCGPFSAAIRPFTVNGSQTRCYVCVNDLLGFEVGDLESGEKLLRVEVEGFEKGPVKRHGCPSHGIGITPDETQLWLCDGHNSRLHVFDLTAWPPRQKASIALREQPGWVSFRADGRHAIASTGEIIDIDSREIVAALQDEQGREVHSEKIVEIHFADGRPVFAGDQFGLGQRESLRQ